MIELSNKKSLAHTGSVLNAGYRTRIARTELLLARMSFHMQRVHLQMEILIHLRKALLGLYCAAYHYFEIICKHCLLGRFLSSARSSTNHSR